MGILTFYALLYGTSLTKALKHKSPNDHVYSADEDIKLKVNKLTSTKALFPLDYNDLPFCLPRKHYIEYENLGQRLVGDRIRNSPYLIKTMRNAYCEILCNVYVGHAQQEGSSIGNDLARAIQNHYHHNWIIDDRPIYTQYPDYYQGQTNKPLPKGFPVGFIARTKKAYVYNHIKITFHYHLIEDGLYKIDLTTITPYSIGYELSDVFNITNPIRNCDPVKGKRHINNEDAMHHYPQIAEGNVLFTYEVDWIEDGVYQSKNISSSKPAYFSKVLWMTNANNIFVVVFLSLLMSILVIRNLRKGLDGYLKLESIDDKLEYLEQFSWKLVYADVLRTPPYPMCLSAACGTGIQIFLGVLSSLIYLLFFHRNQAKNGAILMIMLSFCMIMGIASGYVSANLYKTFQGKELRKNALITALGLPAALFTTFAFIQGHAVTSRSTLAVSLGTTLQLLITCLSVQMPLVLLGYYFGQKHKVIRFPETIRTSPSPTSEPHWCLRYKLSTFVCGILPFSSIYVIMFIIMLQVWSEMNVIMVKNLLVSFTLFILISGLTSILSSFIMFWYNYYHWWWHAFGQGASVGIMIFLYALKFSFRFQSTMVLTYWLYFFCMALVSLMIGVMTGAISVLSSLWFTLKLFDSLK